MTRRNLAVVLLCVALFACGGGGKGGGPSGPTEPTPKNILVIDVALVPQTGGLQEASLTLDGREIFHLSLTSGSCQSDCQLAATVTDVPAGSHTIEATVIRQTRTSITYVTLGQVTVGTSTGGGQQIALPTKTLALRAGDRLTYPITI
jgi:hypothetical protein